MNRPQQFSETARLHKVIIGRWEGYRRVEAYVERVNMDQQNKLPTAAELQPEFEAFRAALEAEGVTVLQPDYIGKFVYDQLTPRDIAVTIGHQIVLCNMIKKSRRYEVAGIFPHLLALEGEEPNILIPPRHDMLLEGGDILIDKGYVFVGLSQRTNQAGFDYLHETFGHQFELVPMHCKSLEEGENVLHLDCTFNPVGKQHALIYPPGLRSIPEVIRDRYEWIEVTAEEQAALATNVLSVDENTVISRAHPACRRVNSLMRSIGLRVIEVPFDGAPSTGGSFRCCSLPLVRR